MLLLLGLSVTTAGCVLSRGGPELQADDQGGSGGATSSAGAGQNTTTSSSPGGEDCLNGLDDDNDGQTDCDDSDCQPDYQCVPQDDAAQGYLSQIADGDSCPPETGTVTVSACACESCTALPGTCSIDVSISQYSDCSFPFGTLSSGDCNTLPPPNSTRYFRLESLDDNNDSSCAQLGSAIATPTSRTSCETAVAGSCADGRACVRRPAETMLDCIRVAPGTAQCPTTYPVQLDGFEGTPTDSCNCDCGITDNTCDPPHTTAYASNSCGGDGSDVLLTLDQCSGAVPGMSAHYVPLLSSTPSCALDVTLPGTTPSMICCTN